MNKKYPPISVYILTFNNERTIRNCIESVVSYADEVIILDSGSTDQTLSICKSFPVEVHQQDWAGFRRQYQTAANLTKNKWIMFVDADEVVPKPLWEELKVAIVEDKGAFDGYVVSRLNFFLGRWIQYGAWGSDREIRVYRRDKGHWEGGLHAKIIVDGPIKILRGKYLHFPYRDIAKQIETLNRYSDVASKDMFEQDKHIGGIYTLARVLFRFFKEYILKRGFMDGFPGFYIASANAFYVLTKYAKLWELGKQKNTEQNDETSI